MVVDMDPMSTRRSCGAASATAEMWLSFLQRNEVVAESRISRIVDRARRSSPTAGSVQESLFGDLEKALREGDFGKRVDFYTHDEGWKNKLVCGDSLAVMESLMAYEGLRERVQMIYLDPPYGI